ncbi:MAG: fibronectin type III domain-containing protein [Clostridiales bacterium]|nr:fibronectin type III domain-containing protein [Clostridiales bacterium]
MFETKRKKWALLIIAAAFVLITSVAIVLPIVLTDRGGEPTQLAVPAGVKASADTKMLTWNAVEEALGYVVSVDDIEKPRQTAVAYNLAPLAAGTYSLKVMAVGDGERYTNSPWSAALSYTAPSAFPDAPARGPSAPQNFAAAPGDRQVTLSWTAPESDGGSEITRYEVTINHWRTSDTTTALTYTFTGLDNGKTYTFKVRALNDVDAGAETEVDATPVTVPAAPKNFAATPGDAQVVLSWTALSGSAQTGGTPIIEYQVRMDDEPWVTADTDTAHTFTGLTNGQAYTFMVRARNAVGGGAAAEIGATPVTVPAAPANFVATPGDRQVTLTWTKVPDDANGGLTITGYEVSSDDGLSWTDASGTSHTFTGLENSKSYTFKVRARNALGGGAASEAAATPTASVTIPSVPRNFTAAPGDGQVTLTWETPASDGGADDIWYEVWITDGDWEEADSDAGHTFTGLTNGEPYTFKVRARNSAGPGVEAEVIAAPATVPAAPANFVAAPGDRQVTLRWTAVPDNANGGAAITKYEVSGDGGGTWECAGSSAEYTFTGLENGAEYIFKVRAVNSAGPGTAAELNATPATVPDAPANLAAAVSAGRVDLTWVAPAYDGGAPITAYQVSGDGGSTWECVGLSTSHTFTGLANGTTYTFKVRAVNAMGAGAENTVTAKPVTVPDAPGSFLATPGDRQVTLSWTVPADGGEAITLYQVWMFGGVGWEEADSNTGHLFTGLKNDESYTFKVRAHNALGDSAASEATATPKAQRMFTTESVEIGEAAGLMITGLTPAYADIQHLVIPAEIDSEPVLKIAKEAFSGNLNLRSAVIQSDGALRQIEAGAFMGCANLTSYTAPFTGEWDNAAPYFGRVFGRLTPSDPDTVPTVLATVTITVGTVPGGHFGNGAMLYTDFSVGAFEGCANIRSIHLDNDLTEIGANSFKGCASLEKLWLPTGLLTLDPTAFIGCDALTSLRIPASVSAIGAGGFGGGITSLSVHADNTVYASAGTYLYKKSTPAVLQHGSKATDLTAAAAVTQIADSAFADCQFIEFTVPDRVTSIGINVFGGCTSLHTLKLPYLGSAMSASESLGYLFSTAASTSSRNAAVPQSLKRVELKTVGNNGLVSSVFDGCQYIETIVLPDFSGIPSRAFKNCTALAALSTPNGISGTIEFSAFENCASLESIKFKEGPGVSITIRSSDVGNGAFLNAGLTSLDLTNHTSGRTITVERGAFTGCAKLARMDLTFNSFPTNATTRQLASFFWLADATANNAAHVPASLKTIVYRTNDLYVTMFQNCKNVETFVWNRTLPSAFKIPANTFAGCAALKTFALSNYLDFSALDANVFAGSNAVNRVFFGNGQAGGGQAAFASVFADCPQIKNAANKYYALTGASRDWHYDANGLPAPGK